MLGEKSHLPAESTDRSPVFGSACNEATTGAANFKEVTSRLSLSYSNYQHSDLSPRQGT